MPLKIGRKKQQPFGVILNLEPQPLKPTNSSNLLQCLSQEEEVKIARGLVLPSCLYLGPFNSLDKGNLVNKADEAARACDIAYDKLLKEGKNPYLTFNQADQVLVDTLKDDTSFGGKSACGVFQAKKWPLSPIGLVDMGPPNPKCPKVADEAGEARDLPRQTSLGTGSPEAQVNPAQEMATGEARDIEAASGGGRGVGEPSGNRHCDSQ